VAGADVHRLIAVPLLVLLAACSSPAPTLGPSSPGPLSPTPTLETLPASIEPSPSAPLPSLPTPAPTAAAFDVLAPGAAVAVAVKELSLRRFPTTSSKRLAVLDRGDILIVSPGGGVFAGWGPVAADGYKWYPVTRPQIYSPDHGLPALPQLPFWEGPLVSGWVAAGDKSKPYLVPLPPRCPETVDLVNVAGMLDAERLACFEPQPFVLEGTYGCGDCGGTTIGTFKPNWLANPFEFNYLTVDLSTGLGPTSLHFRPAGPVPPAAGSIIRATVHIDDARSSRCEMTGIGSEGASVVIDARTAVLWCRERLVVDSYELLGVDPSFSPG
jgi:hypothetical protein